MIRTISRAAAGIIAAAVLSTAVAVSTATSAGAASRDAAGVPTPASNSRTLSSGQVSSSSRQVSISSPAPAPGGSSAIVWAPGMVAAQSVNGTIFVRQSSSRQVSIVSSDAVRDSLLATLLG